MKNVVLGLIALTFLISGILTTTLNNVKPLVREAREHPIYTIGDATFTEAVADGKKVVKFGTFLFGIIDGGIAFATEEEAAAYRDSLLHTGEHYGIFLLSGDFAKDTYRDGDHYRIKESMQVIERID